MHSKNSTSPVSRTIKIATGAVAAGDVIFVYPHPAGFMDKLKRNINVFFQQAKGGGIFTAQRRFSHVMLGLDAGRVIHADGRKVTTDLLSEALNVDATVSTFEVYRLKENAKTIGAKAAEAANRFYKNEYDILDYVKEHPSKYRQFCSRLVAHAFASCGVTLSAKPEHKVLPVDIYKACLGDEWEDVTGEFVKGEINWKAHQVDVPGIGAMNEEFFEECNRLLNGTGRIQQELAEHRHRATQQSLAIHALIWKRKSLQATQTYALIANPGLISEEEARWVRQALDTLGTIYEVGHFSELPTNVNVAGYDPARPDYSPHVNFPTYAELIDMDRQASTRESMSVILLAQFGMLSISSRYYSDSAGHDKFREVPDIYIDEFLAAVPRCDIDSLGTDVDQPFLWLVDEGERKQACHSVNVSRRIHKVIETARIAEAQRQ